MAIYTTGLGLGFGLGLGLRRQSCTHDWDLVLGSVVYKPLPTRRAYRLVQFLYGLFFHLTV